MDPGIDRPSLILGLRSCLFSSRGRCWGLDEPSPTALVYGGAGYCVPVAQSGYAVIGVQEIRH